MPIIFNSEISKSRNATYLTPNFTRNLVTVGANDWDVLPNKMCYYWQLSLPLSPICSTRPVEHIGSKLIVYSLKGSRQNSSQSFAAYKLGVSSIVPNGLLPQTVSQWYISPHGLQYICTSMYVILCTYIWLHTAEKKNPTGCSVLCFGLGLRGRKRLTYLTQWG